MPFQIGRAIFCGFLATSALTTIMLANWISGLLPQIDLVRVLQGLFPINPAIGFATHVLIGSLLLGPIFGLVKGILPGSTDTVKGITFGLMVWLACSPVTGYALLTERATIGAMLVTLLYFVAFGATLGWLWGELVTNEPETE